MLDCFGEEDPETISKDQWGFDLVDKEDLLGQKNNDDGPSSIGPTAEMVKLVPSIIDVGILDNGLAMEGDNIILDCQASSPLTKDKVVKLKKLSEIGVDLIKSVGENSHPGVRNGVCKPSSSEDPFDLVPLISKLNPVNPHILPSNRTHMGSEFIETFPDESMIAAKEVGKDLGVHDDADLVGIRQKLKEGRKAKWMVEAQSNGAGKLDGGTVLNYCEIRACNLQILKKHSEELASELCQI